VIIVDATVWIDFLEARGTAFDRTPHRTYRGEAPISLVDIIRRGEPRKPGVLLSLR
jgi:hypothetical protein